MRVKKQVNKKEILDMIFCKDVSFVFCEGGIHGVDMKHCVGITKGDVLAFIPEELYDIDIPGFCMLWNGNGKLLREKITSNKGGVYVCHGSRAHKILSSLCHQGMLMQCCKLWY